MQSVAAAAVPKLGDWCALHFLPVAGEPPLVAVGHANPDKVTWAHELVERYPFDPDAPSGTAAVIRTGEAEFIPEFNEQLVEQLLDESSIDTEEARRIMDALDLTSVITVPLESKRGVLGAMQFVSAESKRHYDESDLTLAQAAAGRIADALDNMWLTDQQRHIAATLQAALLPPELPDVPGVDIAVRYWPAGAAVEVGGDFYDVFPLDDRRWAVVIGDVCGTGPNGAAVTGIARHTIRAAARHGQDPRGVLEWLNDALLHSNRELFCTTCYATLERQSDDTWLLTAVSGGHPLPVLVRYDGTCESVGRYGTLLGIFDTIRNFPTQTSMSRGDTLVLFTDGVTDVPPPHGLSDEAVGQLFGAAARTGDAERTADAIQLGLSEHLPMEQRKDDVALVVLKVADNWPPQLD
jgi:serine phosphatase RsbU (regulator of sigma subunit)